MRKWFILLVIISCVYICNGKGRQAEAEVCQLTQQCIEESVLLATNAGAREYTPYCEDTGDCKSLCGSLEECCHPYVVKRNVSHDRTLQSCMPRYFGNLEVYSTVPKLQKSSRSYYTVDKDPPGGCVEEYDGNNGCSSIMAEWGTYYPVSSKFSKLIYVNVECARCHGENNVKHWEVVHRCMENGVIETYYPEEEMRKVNLDNCFSLFFTSIDLYILKSQCYAAKLIDSCRTDFKLSADSHLSRSIVESLCNSGLVSPRRHFDPDISYANLFCLICNVDLDWTNMTEEQKECKALSGGGRVESFTSFIEAEEVHDEGRKRHVIDTKLACSVTIPEYCRPVYCSTGKLLVDGACQFVTDAFVNGQYMLDVTLTYADDFVLFYLSYIEEPETEEQLKSALKGPWADKWDIYAMSVKYSIHHTRPTEVVNNIFITMVYKPYMVVYIQDLISEVEFVLKSSWSYVSPSEHRQFKLDSKLGHDIKLTKEARTMFRNMSIILDTPLEEVQLKHVISPRYNISKNATNNLSKLFFCQQIKLYPHEYILFDDFSFVYLKQQGRLLADGEYIVGISDMSKSIKVCLEDAGYDIGMLTSIAEALLYSPHQSCVLTYISTLVAVYIYIV